jgi:hypothetical protein
MSVLRPPGRWSDEDTALLSAMREQLGDKLSKRRQLPDVVGDRRLLRFLRGHGRNVNKACEVFTKFLTWRDENNVDDVRDYILQNPCVDDFPHANKILSFVSQIVIAHDALDYNGHPICFENYSFDVEAVIKGVSKEEYLEFMTYTLEYRSMVLEQMSELREQEYLKKCNYEPPKTPDGYGIMLQVATIRDTHGLGLSHMGANGRMVLGWIIAVAGQNYPETLFRSYMVKAPFMIDAVWVIIKQFMDPNTVAKNVMLGSSYMNRLLEDMPKSSIPAVVGGDYHGFNTEYKFAEQFFREGGITQHVGSPITVVTSASPTDFDEPPVSTENHSATGSEVVTLAAAPQYLPVQTEVTSSPIELCDYVKGILDSRRPSSVVVLTTTTGKSFKSWLPPSSSAASPANSNGLYQCPQSLVSTAYNGLHQVGEYKNVNEYLNMALQVPGLEPSPALVSPSMNKDQNGCTIS